jgi:hypothetical protein
MLELVRRRNRKQSKHGTGGWKNERKSCIQTVELLRRLAFNVHGVMDIIDAQNVDKIIEMLEKPEPYKEGEQDD